MDLVPTEMELPIMELPEPSRVEYDQTIDISSVQHILFVHSSVKQLQVASSATTFSIVYDFSSSTDEVLAIMESKFRTFNSIARVGFAFHYTGASSRFMNKDALFSESDLQGGVRSKNMQFMIDLINRFHVSRVDFFACNTLLDNSWKQYYQILQSETGVIVGASDDNTGNLRYGGDWIMESTQEDVSQIYFTSAIIDFASLLLTYVDNNVSYSYTAPGSGTVGTASVLSATASMPASYTVLSSFVVGAVTYTVTSIGANAFIYRQHVTNLTIPNTITLLGNSCLSEMHMMGSFVIPNSITSLPSDLFANCSILTSITVPNSVKSIGSGAFRYLGLITSITIPQTVTSIGKMAFMSNYLMSSFIWPSNCPRIDDTTFSGCVKLANFIIPDTVTYIGGDAFGSCSSITNLILPPNLSYLGDYGIAGTSLTSITIPSSLRYIGVGALNLRQMPSVIIPNTVTYLGREQFMYCNKLTSVVLPDSITEIGQFFFYRNYALKSLTIPSTVTSIGNCAFTDCLLLTNITLPSVLKTIGTEAFVGFGATSITIPSSVTFIDARAFMNTSLSSLVFAEPANPNLTIGNWAFKSIRLSYIDLGKTKLKSIPNQMFMGTGAIVGKRTVILPYGVTSVGQDAFNNFSDSFELIVIPNTITTLPSSSFYQAYTSGVGMTYTCQKLIMFTSSDLGVTKQYYQYVGTMPVMTTAGNTAFNNIINSFNTNKTNTSLWSSNLTNISSVTPSVTNIKVGESFSVKFFSLAAGTTYSITGVSSSDIAGTSLSGTIPEGQSFRTFTATSGGSQTIVITTSDNVSGSIYIKPSPYIATKPTTTTQIYPNPLSSFVLSGGSALSTIGGNVVAGTFRVSPDISNAIYQVGTYTNIPVLFVPTDTANYSNATTTIESVTITRATAAQLQASSLSTTALRAVGYTATELKTANFTTTQLKNASFSPTELKAAGVTKTELYSVFTTPTEQKSVTKMVVETEVLATTTKAVISNPNELVGYSFDPTIASVLAVKVSDVSVPISINRNELNNGATAVYAVLDLSGSYINLPTHSSLIKIMNIGNDKYRIISKDGVTLRDNLLIGDTFTNDGTTVVIGSVTATMTQPPGIEFVFTDFLDLQFTLSAKGTLPQMSATVPMGQYTLERDISLSTMKSAFYYQTDDAINYDASYTKYFVDISGWTATTMKQDLNPMHFQVKSVPNGAFGNNTTDNLGKHFLRYIADQLFGTYLGVDLFENEDTVYADISSNSYTNVYIPILNKLKRVDKTFGATSDLIDISNSSYGYFMQDSSGTYNICRSLMQQIIGFKPERLSNLDVRDGAGTGFYNVPFSVGDSIYFSVIVTPDPNQHLVTAKTSAIESKRYNLKLNIV
jgi:uncharacterized protein YjbI with pentapeptide repeats